MPTAIVTGGAVRIGRALALHLARGGWDIALHYNGSEESAQSAIEEIIALGRQCKGFQCDFSDLKSAESLIERVSHSFADIRLLINSASIFLNPSIENTASETLQDTLNINLAVPFLLMRDYKRKIGQGMIVNILDQRIQRNIPGFSAYSVSKAGLTHLTELAALEWGSSMRVNAIAPGLILPPANGSPDYLQRASAEVPMKTHGDVSDITRGLQYLLDSPFVNGETLFIDGGESKV
jgi:pteridine reductase